MISSTQVFPRSKPASRRAFSRCRPARERWNARSPAPATSRHAFTLIELIFVMALLAIAAALVAPRMVSFFRGRALGLEAQRLLALTHYGQSRAVAEGVPVLLWLNPKDSTYGMSLQSGYVETDDRPSSYTLDSSLTLEAPTVASPAISELQDEKFGLPEGLPVIRFNPDGFIDEISQPKIVLRQGDEAALQLVQTTNRLGYEIQPYHADANH